MRKTILTGITIALIAAPFVSSASTLSDLQSQITSLLAQIQALQTQGSASTSVGVSGSGTITGTVVSACPVPARSLSLGSRGQDVAALQQFLAAHGYLHVAATGYFGALTRAAVGRWQVASGVTTSNGAGFGIFGPMSRSFFARFCGGTQNQQAFSADPQSGSAPLTTTFTTSDSIVSSSTYSVDFGDGTSGGMTKGSCIAITAIVGGQGGIRCSFTVSHTYNSNGTYTVKLFKQTPFVCPNGLMCAESEAMMLPAPQVVATLTVTVGPTTNPSLSANPTSGTAPLSVTFSVPGVSAQNYWAINFGDGQNASLIQGSVTHQYAANGTYTASAVSDYPCLHATPFCEIAQQTYGSVTITVGASTTSGVNFYASPTSGQAPLSVQFTATAPQGTELGNTINFGDGSSGALGVVPVCSSCNAEGIASHTYQSVGTYTTTLTNNMCSCPANGICNCPNIMILGSATVTVTATSTASNDTRLNAPGSVTLQAGGIAEVRNESYYFTLTGLTAATATIQVTPVGCWNSFPSDTPPQIRCMIYMIPAAPQTLSVGQTATTGNNSITLTQLNGSNATFSVNAVSSGY
ncbi:MAG TPA: PKD domain-containing protein [Candidatus Paceibacterota bacterium]|jgi:PKD repeat protein|nr:PKD domain-containing protein [Candidatus Paceibacterota bacterium]